MKTKELIRQLNEADPSGELECCVSNTDIYFVQNLPAYYDGCLQTLIHDEEKKPYYSIVGGKYTDQGRKVDIRTHSIADALLDHPDMPVTFDLSEPRLAYYQQQVEERRAEMVRIHEECEQEMFVEYVKKRLAIDWNEDFKFEDAATVAKEFYDENLKATDPMPKEVSQRRVVVAGNEAYPSYRDKRFWQWEKEISVDVYDGEILISKNSVDRA